MAAAVVMGAAAWAVERAISPWLYVRLDLQLARIVGVHPDTVSEWETAPGPVRIKDASYRKLAQLADAANARSAKSRVQAQS